MDETAECKPPTQLDLALLRADAEGTIDPESAVARFGSAF